MSYVSSPTTISRSFLHSLPNASEIDITAIRGNLSDEEKRLGANLFAYFTNGSDTYGASIGRRLKFVEMNIWGRDATGSASQGQTVFEIDVESGKEASLPT